MENFSFSVCATVISIYVSIQVFGCLVLATGIWIKLESHKYLDVDPSNPITYQVSVFLMTAGVAIAMVGLLSCYCTLSGSPILLYLVNFSVLLTTPQVIIELPL